jgi:hypothetical protein
MSMASSRFEEAQDRQSAMTRRRAILLYGAVIAVPVSVLLFFGIQSFERVTPTNARWRSMAQEGVVRARSPALLWSR